MLESPPPRLHDFIGWQRTAPRISHSKLSSNVGSPAVRALVFGRHLFSAPQSITEKPMEVYYRDELIIITLHVAGFLHPAIFWYFHHSSDKSGLKVADCTVQSAEYRCFYGTVRAPVFGTLKNAIKYFQISFNRIIVIKYKNIAGCNRPATIQRQMYKSFMQMIFHRLFRNALRCRILVPLRYPSF